MKRIQADKISSASINLNLDKDLRLGKEIISESGYALAGRIHGNKTVYNTLEDCSGRMIPINEGDIIVGVLGHRDALKGYSGRVPDEIAVGDTLQVLNLGGVIGECTSNNPQVGRPFDFEVLGSVLVFPEFGSRKGTPGHVQQHSTKKISLHAPRKRIPVVYVAGTCMHAGKTSAAAQIIKGLRKRGIEVAACKLTGVSLLRDTLEMVDYGAKWACSFIDAGIVTTDASSAVPAAKKIFSTLIDEGAEVIVAELGDGILGTYGVKEILADKDLMSFNQAFILCANDPVGAWGSIEILNNRYGIKTDIISGPTTDNLAGVRYVEEELKTKALNARTHPAELSDEVFRLVEPALLPKDSEPTHQGIVAN